MLSKESQVNEEDKKLREQNTPSQTFEQNFTWQEELENLEILLQEGVKVPLTELILIDREQLLKQLYLIKTKLPIVFAQAKDVLSNKHRIIQEAEDYAYNLVESAEDSAAQIISKSALVRQAELEATKIMFQVHKECEQLRQKTQAEIEQLKKTTIEECQRIQVGSDNYADAVLGDLEQQLSDMLSVIRNGRQQLERDSHK